MSTPTVAAALAASYLLGSIPFALLIVRLRGGPDVRTVGSGNVGATNAGRAAGRAVGAVVLLLDALKAAVPTALALRSAPLRPALACACGMASFLGHCFPIFLKGRGGKGVACALGVLLVLSPVATLIAALAFGITYGATRIVSASSLVGGAAAVVALWALVGVSPVAMTATAMVAVIGVRHISNIRRLLRGEEPRS